MKKPINIVIVISVFYAFLHIIQLEVFPFYHFGMYSEQIEMPETFSVYEIKLDNKVLDYRKLNYRRYVYITNTLKEYDALQSSGNLNPSAQIIRKYFGVLPMPSIEKWLLRPHQYDNPQLFMKRWLSSVFPKTERISVLKKVYRINNGTPILQSSQIVFQ